MTPRFVKLSHVGLDHAEPTPVRIAIRSIHSIFREIGMETTTVVSSGMNYRVSETPEQIMAQINGLATSL